MRKPNYLQIKANAGRVCDDFYIRWIDIEKNADEVSRLLYDAAVQSESAFTEAFLLNLRTLVNNVKTKVNRLEQI